jgi:hypothetical protein
MNFELDDTLGQYQIMGMPGRGGMASFFTGGGAGFPIVCHAQNASCSQDAPKPSDDRIEVSISSLRAHLPWRNQQPSTSPIPRSEA